MSDVWVFIEGGDRSDVAGKGFTVELRKAFARFFEQRSDAPDPDRQRVHIALCGGRLEALADFVAACRNWPSRTNLLLVDSEGPMPDPEEDDWAPPADLQAQSAWDSSLCPDDRLHFMVQCMEAWLVADRGALRRHYGERLSEDALPDEAAVEAVAVDDLLDGLRRATTPTYSKGRHAPAILALADPEVVRSHAPHCDRFLKRLDEAVSTAIR